MKGRGYEMERLGYEMKGLGYEMKGPGYEMKGPGYEMKDRLQNRCAARGQKRQGQRGSTVMPEPGHGPAVAVLGARTAAAGPDRVRTVAVGTCAVEASAACDPGDSGELGRAGRGPAAG
jgi:hypothetical protein